MRKKVSKRSIKEKIGIFIIAVVLAFTINLCFDFFIVEYTSSGFGEIINEISLCYELSDALAKEKADFAIFIRNRDNIETLIESCKRTDEIVDKLELDIERRERYAKIWSIKNSYPIYAKSRQEIIESKYDVKDFIEKVYDIYEMQDYLIGYGERLMDVTLSENNAIYQKRSEFFKKMPLLIGIILIPIIVLVVYMALRLQTLIISPINKMVEVSKNIAKNDFSDDDIVIKNNDEMGDLTNAFNKMKHATSGYISSLEERYELSELLHKEAMEKMNMEKRLNEARFDLLKNQINPHFLFNTLNIIAASANLEDAKDTEDMIRALGNIFRYSLKTDEKQVSLERELSIVQDYMYIQKMRFGERVFYDIDSKVENDRVFIPSFSLQPIVENAIVHGISKKEEGGKVVIRVWERENVLHIIVADTGVGMSEERLEELRDFMQKRPTSKIGIGFGNIYKRIKNMYKNGDLRIYSKEGKMTVVYFLIPQADYS